MWALYIQSSGGRKISTIWATNVRTRRMAKKIMPGKLEIRNPKSETNSNSKLSKVRNKNRSFEFFPSVIVSDFETQLSSFAHHFRPVTTNTSSRCDISTAGVTRA